MKTNDKLAPAPAEALLADFATQERQADDAVLALSAQRAALADEFMRLNKVLGDVAEAGDATLAESLGQLFYFARSHRAQGPDEMVRWAEVEALVLTAFTVVGDFRQVVKPVVEAMSLSTRNMATLLDVADREIEARAALLVAAQHVQLAAEAVRFPVQ